MTASASATSSGSVNAEHSAHERGIVASDDHVQISDVCVERRKSECGGETKNDARKGSRRSRVA